MSSTITRIYKSPDGSGNLLGFSRGATEAAHDPRLGEFLTERGYSLKIMPLLTKTEEDALIWYYEESERIPEQAVSYSYVEVQPPMSEEHIKEFGSLCVRELIDSGNNYTYVVDNRTVLPDGPMGSGGDIITWR